MSVHPTYEMRPIGALLAEKNIVLKGADVLSRGGFTQVPNIVLESDAISPGAKLAYAMLLKYAWQNASVSRAKTA